MLSNLSSPDEERLQREAIFHTRCTIGGKVCSMIIDGGSCTNVASQTMVDKLKLKMTPHPKPYAIQWLNQNKGMQVNQQILLSFSLGKLYDEELWCDVIPMDACHLLLGRPWMFDRKVHHDGYKNTYTFMRNGKKIVLTPETPKSKPTQTKTPQNTSVTTVLKAELPECKSQKHHILLCLHKSVPFEKSSQPLLAPLFKEYDHVLKYVQFKVGDLAWSRIRKERFPNRRKSKMSPQSDGPFAITEKMNYNVCKVELPSEYGVSSILSIADLSPYYDAFEELPSLRANSFQEEGYVVGRSAGVRLS